MEPGAATRPARHRAIAGHGDVSSASKTQGHGRRQGSEDEPAHAGLLDQYVSRLYMRVVALAFLALVGLFYISTFIDASDKLFKGTANGSMVMSLLVYRTPQFMYFVIPIAALLSVLVTFGLLSRTSELTVMKACGISLYRVALPIVAAVAALQRRAVRTRSGDPGACQSPRDRDRRPDSRPSAEDLQPTQPPVDDRS